MQIDLISMPWALFNRPSIQLGSLRSFLSLHLQACRVNTHHPYLEIAEKIGLDRYQRISANSWAGEALYSGLLFPEHRDRSQSLFRREMGAQLAGKYETILEQLDRHLQGWLQRTDFTSSQLLGFSVCFSQLLSSLFAAKNIKEQHPHLPIVFGGSTCTPVSAKSLLRVFPFIDYIVVGEGEKPLLALSRYLGRQADFPAANVLTRKREAVGSVSQTCAKTAVVKDLNSLPVPDYTGYFKELARQGSSFIPSLPVEFSRGCWWNKCAFCNLNLQWHGYRCKQHQRMFAEVTALANRYQSLDFCFTDNALPPKETDLFFNNLRQQGSDIHFFAEIRAFKTPQQYAASRAGGLHTVQIGIEALSQSLLTRMNKGITLMENVAAMKYSAENDLQLEGNLILEFPGSTENEVNETLNTLDAVLPFAPLQAARFFLGYASPVYEHPARYGIKTIAHHPGNRALFPEKILKRLELLINSYRGDRGKQKMLWQPVRNKIKHWHAFHHQRPSTKPPLSYRDGGTFLIIRQERPDRPVYHHRLKGQSRAIYLRCRQPTTKKELLLAFSQIKEKQLIDFLDDLVGKHLLFEHNATYLALAIHSQITL